MTPAQDEVVALLKEIRDLQKEQNTAMAAERAEEEHAKIAGRISMVVKILLYIIVFTFTGGAALYYYKTISTLTSM